MKVLRTANRFQEDVKKSKFIAQALPIHDGNEALAQIAKLSDHTASHNCWAFRTGDVFRFSDDGEPSGTAGRPILAAIDNNGFDQTLILVTRIYGGIQLGTGGLARAYGSAAKQCLLSAAAKTLVKTTMLTGFCPYAQLDTLKARLNSFSANIDAETFEPEGANLTISIATENVAAVEPLLTNLTRGSFAFKIIE